MDEQNGAAQLRYLEEVSIRLRRSSFETMPLEERHLPVKWNGSYLCRVSGSGSVLYREADIERHHAQDILQDVIHTARMTSEYMAMLEQAPQLKANGLVGTIASLPTLATRCWQAILRSGVSSLSYGVGTGIGGVFIREITFRRTTKRPNTILPCAAALFPRTPFLTRHSFRSSTTHWCSSGNGMKVFRSDGIRS